MVVFSNNGYWLSAQNQNAWPYSLDEGILNLTETPSAISRDHHSHREGMAQATPSDLCKHQCLNQGKSGNFWNDPFWDTQRCIVELTDHEQTAGR